MSHAGVMVRCPTTGRELSTGVEMDTATFERLPDIHSRIKCPLCRVDHNWSTREAWPQVFSLLCVSRRCRHQNCDRQRQSQESGTESALTIAGPYQRKLTPISGPCSTKSIWFFPKRPFSL
jgi:hypothetical protein